MSKVWVTGDAVVDLIPDGEQHYLKCPGGAPANVAVAIARLGGQSAFFGRVGNDPLGRFIHQTLTNERVDSTHLLLDDQQRTSTVVVDLDGSGERSFTFMVKPSADQFLQPNDIPEFHSGEWLHACSIALANEPSRSSTFEAMDRIKQAGGYISFDPNLREEVWQNPSELIEVVMQAVAKADVVKFSEEEITHLTQTDTIEAGINALKTLNIPLIIITQGAKGALVVTGDQQTLITGKVVKPIDTTGAGDAFVGGLLHKLATSDPWHKDLETAILWAHGCGALATTKKGAMTALPTQQALLDFIR
ncbi:aminoimidazole riboside kinase [Vibrio cincinnatiensis]|uniref:aminoimidazole riboside kinase n=1 Tax=Vibrio cincinnatiensis TaxID=675 RepID=UPI001EE02AE7|nr:aminoimidazole riboside kinase [Vibrio cincinnatiensis]MCG3729748.1 aminoimidazole riboside kinase [Vibrio cincinnatiensis]